MSQVETARAWFEMCRTGDERLLAELATDPLADGQPAHETGIIIFRFAGGKVAETWYEGNDLEIAQQLGGRIVKS